MIAIAVIRRQHHRDVVIGAVVSDRDVFEAVEPMSGWVLGAEVGGHSLSNIHTGLRAALKLALGAGEGPAEVEVADGWNARVAAHCGLGFSVVTPAVLAPTSAPAPAPPEDRWWETGDADFRARLRRT
ncbi:MAG: hypothetical protein AAB368_00450 [bacterium]